MLKHCGIETIDFVFRKVDVHMMQVCHTDFDIASRRVIKKSGFVHEDTLRDYFHREASTQTGYTALCWETNGRRTTSIEFDTMFSSVNDVSGSKLDERNKVIAIVGATGTGKSALADALAAELGGELVGADSIQVYRGMDIGTAKTPVTQRSVPYHCIDLVEPDFTYTAALYQREARRVIDALLATGKPAVVCGGTGLYVRAALDDFRFDENRELYGGAGYGSLDAPAPEVFRGAGNLSLLLSGKEPCGSSAQADSGTTQQQSVELRQRLNAQADQMGPEAFHALLVQHDPKSAALIHPHNVRRVVRAFELLEAGSGYAKQHAGFENFTAVYPTHFIGISVEREVLYESIERRVDTMIAEGLLDEIKALVKSGFGDARAIRQGIGYKEMLSVLEADRSLDAAVAEIKQSTRRYAKRQRTWFKRDPRIVWIDATEEHRSRLAGRMDAATFTRNLLDKALITLQ